MKRSIDIYVYRGTLKLQQKRPSFIGAKVLYKLYFLEYVNILEGDGYNLAMDLILKGLREEQRRGQGTKGGVKWDGERDENELQLGIPTQKDDQQTDRQGLLQMSFAPQIDR